MSIAPRESHSFLNPRTIIESLILAGVLWVGTSVNTLNVKMAEVQVQLADVADGKARLRDLEQRLAVQGQVVANNADRIRELEQREGTP